MYSTSYPVSSTLVAVTPSATSAAESATSSNSPVGEGAPSGGVPAVGTTVNVPTYSYTAVSPVYTTGAAGAGSCPSYSVKTVSTSITTVIPTVVYETVAIPCATGTSSSSPAGVTGSGSTPNNAT